MAESAQKPQSFLDRSMPYLWFAFAILSVQNGCTQQARLETQGRLLATQQARLETQGRLLATQQAEIDELRAQSALRGNR